MTDKFTPTDAEADWELERLYRRFGVTVMEKAIKRRRTGSRSRGRPSLTTRPTEPDAPYLLDMISLAQGKTDVQPYALAREVAEKNSHQIKGDLRSHYLRLGNKFKELQQLSKEHIVAERFMESLKLRMRVTQQRER